MIHRVKNNYTDPGKSMKRGKRLRMSVIVGFLSFIHVLRTSLVLAISCSSSALFAPFGRRSRNVRSATSLSSVTSATSLQLKNANISIPTSHFPHFQNIFWGYLQTRGQIPVNMEPNLLQYISV